MAFSLPWRFSSIANPAHPCSKPSGDCCQYVGQVILIILGTVVALQITINTVCMAIPRLRCLLSHCRNIRLRNKVSKGLTKGLENVSQPSYQCLAKSGDGKNVSEPDLKGLVNGKSLESEYEEGVPVLRDCGTYAPGTRKGARHRSHPCCHPQRRLPASSDSRTSLAWGYGGAELGTRDVNHERRSRRPREGRSPSMCGHPLRPCCPNACRETRTPSSSSGGGAGPCRHPPPDLDPRCSASRSVSRTPDSLAGSGGLCAPRRCVTPDPYRNSASLGPETPGVGGGGGRRARLAARGPARRSPESCASCSSRQRLQTGDFLRPLSPESRRGGPGGKAPNPGRPRPRPLDHYPPPPTPPACGPRPPPQGPRDSQQVNELQRTGRVVYDARVRKAEHARGDGEEDSGGNGATEAAVWGPLPCFYKHQHQRAIEGPVRGANLAYYSYRE